MELTFSDAAATFYTRDDRGQLVGMRPPQGEALYYLVDGLGSVVAVTDAAGQAVNRYAYGPYGEPLQADQALANPWRYTGAWLDTATGLYKMGLRYYSPDLAAGPNPTPSSAPATSPFRPTPTPTPTSPATPSTSPTQPVP